MNTNDLFNSGSKDQTDTCQHADMVESALKSLGEEYFPEFLDFNKEDGFNNKCFCPTPKNIFENEVPCLFKETASLDLYQNFNKENSVPLF